MKTRFISRLALGLIFLPMSLLAQRTTPPSTGATSSPKPPPAVTYESPWFIALAKLAGAGLQEPVLLAYVDGAGTFNLKPEQIITLRDLGVSDGVIDTILQHDTEIALGVRQVPASTVPSISPAMQAALAMVSKRDKASATKAAAAGSPASAPASQIASAAPISSQTPLPAQPASPAPILAADECHETPAHPCLDLAPAEVSPVRKPYAEPLTNPILVVRAAGRAPNVIIIDPLP